MSKDCSFNAAYIDDMIRDWLMFEIRSQDIWKKLFTVRANLTLERAIQVCQTHEYALDELKTMLHTTGSSSGAPAAVNYVDR